MSADDDRTKSMWYCPNCEHWVGYKRDTCNCGATQPRRPVRHDDVQAPAWEVTRWDRLKALIGWYK